MLKPRHAICRREFLAASAALAVAGPLRAELARSFLEQAGISVYLEGASVASAFGLAGGPLAEVRVYVPAAQAEDAARIFAELDFSGEDLADAETDAETDGE